MAKSVDEEKMKGEAPPKTRKSGRYKAGSRKGTKDTRLPKGKEKVLRAELAMAQEQIVALKRRVKTLETELRKETNGRLAREAEELECNPRYRRAHRDLLSA